MSCCVHRKTVLILCRDFPPYGGSAGATRRAESMFSFLQEKGFFVRVLASRGYPGAKKKEAAGVFYANDFFHKRIGKVKHGFAEKKHGRILKVLRSFFKNMLGEWMIPDFAVSMCWRYFICANKLIKKGKIGVIVTSGPVHSIHIVGLLLKRFHGGRIFWIVDYRDSWNCSYLFRKKNRVTNFLSVHLEKKVLQACDHFTYVSNPILTKAMDKFGFDLSRKGTLVMNGHTHDRMAAGKIPDSCGKERDCLKVGYFGFVDDCPGFRDLRILLSYADASGFVVSRCFEFHFFGEVRLFNTDIGKFKNVFVHEPIAYDDVHEKMREMDFLLLYHTESKDADEVVTGKVFDYMLAGRPIICMGPPDMGVIGMIEGNGIGLAVNLGDRKDMEEKFDRLERIGFAYNPGFDLTKYNRNHQYMKLAKIIAGGE
jgi:hypothetical protein